MFRTVGGFLAVAALVYASLVALMYFGQSRLLYFPVAPHAATPDLYGLPWEEVWLRTEDGLRLHAWYLPAPHEHAPVLLFFHGNAGNISHRLDSLRLFHELGLAILIPDYRGYGRSEGRPSEHGTHLDARAAWRHLREEMGTPASRIVLFGRSLGAAVAARLATEQHPGAVILESAFTSVPDLGADLYPWLPVRRLARFRYDTLGLMGTIAAPVLILHSQDDEIVPYSHGQRLFAAAGEPRAFISMRGGHNDGFLVTGADYRDGIADFLSDFVHRRP